MTKISKILIDSQKTRTQMTSSLVDYSGDPYLVPDKYCALGAIGCELGLIKVRKDADNLAYSKILTTAGVHQIDQSKLYLCPKKNCFHSHEGLSLYTFIIHLNDGHFMTFKQIGQHLKKLGL